MATASRDSSAPWGQTYARVRATLRHTLETLP
jgi:hypothetical protein